MSFLKNLPLGWLGQKKNREKLKNAFAGTSEIRENVSTLRPEQEPLYEQSVNAGLAPGAGGAFGTAADYYRNIMSDDNADIDAFSRPELRRFNEEIIPDLSEQFAGMGSGGLSSSGFRNAAVNAGTDLSERLGAIRAQLRQQGAAGLTNIGQIGLNSYSQNMVTEPGTPGLLGTVAPAIGTAAGAYFGGPGGAAAGNAAGQGVANMFKNSFGENRIGRNTSPYGGNTNGYNGSFGSLPNFGGR